MEVTRRTFLKCSAAGVATALAGFGDSTLIEPERLSLERVRARVLGLSTALEGLRIAVLGGFHLHPYTKIHHVQEAVKLSNSLNPDLVVLLGDYVDATVEAIHELVPELSHLSGRLGVFGVLERVMHFCSR